MEQQVLFQFRLTQDEATQLKGILLGRKNGLSTLIREHILTKDKSATPSRNLKSTLSGVVKQLNNLSAILEQEVK